MNNSNIFKHSKEGHLIDERGQSLVDALITNYSDLNAEHIELLSNVLKCVHCDQHFMIEEDILKSHKATLFCHECAKNNPEAYKRFTSQMKGPKPIIKGPSIFREQSPQSHQLREYTISEAISYGENKSTWGGGGESQRISYQHELLEKLITSLEKEGALPLEFIEFIKPEGFDFIERSGK